MTSIAPAPPEAWAMELYGNRREDNSENMRTGGVIDAYDAWKHCKDVTTKDDSRPPDLYDLLSHSVGESQYAFPPKGVREIICILGERGNGAHGLCGNVVRLSELPV
jgi:hypothetical protein